MTEEKNINITGRPSKFGDVWTKENEKKTLELYSQGAGDIEIVALLGIARDTFYNWLKDKEKLGFSDTIKRGKVLSQVWWERNGRMNLHSKDFNNNLWARNMTCRFRDDWTDSNDNGKQPIVIQMQDFKENNEDTK